MMWNCAIYSLIIIYQVMNHTSEHPHDHLGKISSLNCYACSSGTECKDGLGNPFLLIINLHLPSQCHDDQEYHSDRSSLPNQACDGADHHSTYDGFFLAEGYV